MSDESDKIRFLEFVSQRATGRMNERRGYEWKMCFSLWTAIGVATGFALSSQDLPKNPLMPVIVLVFSAITMWVFWKWVKGIRTNNKHDVDMALRGEAELSNIVGMKLLVSVPEAERNLWKHWSHGAQLWITALLLALFVLVVSTRTYVGEKPVGFHAHVEVNSPSASRIVVEPAGAPAP